MEKDIIFFPEQASTTARQVDLLLYFLTGICGAVGLGVAVVLIYFAIRYRRRPNAPPPPPMPGNKALELFWTLTPLAIFMVMFVWGATVYFGAYRAPDDATPIYGIGKQWMWKFQHPQGQREINELHVSTDRSFKLLLSSEDVIHSFFVPEFRAHMDVLPGRYTTVWFRPTRPGKYHLFCSQYCGTNHAGMIGTVYVMEPLEYQRWLSEAATGSMAEQGGKVFLKYRCISCHGGDERDHPRAPLLEELYGRRVPLRDGREALVDDEYIRRSIYDPGADIVLGWENIMPTFEGEVSLEEVNQLVAYIKGLRRGQTPRRVEQSPPPKTTPPINAKK